MKLIRVAGLVVVSVLTVVALQALVAAYGAEDAAPLAESSRVFIQPGTISVEAGETFTVGVMVENAQDMVTYEFEMSWESSVLTVTDVVDAGFLLETPTELKDISEGELSFNALVPPPYEGGRDGDGALAVITLRAVGSGLSRLILDENDVRWYDADDPGSPHIPAVSHGTVVVDGRFLYLPLVVRNYLP